MAKYLGVGVVTFTTPGEGWEAPPRSNKIMADTGFTMAATIYINYWDPMLSHNFAQTSVQMSLQQNLIHELVCS